METSTICILFVASVAFASAATTMNPITGMTGMSTDIITEVGTTIIDNSTSLPSTQASSTKPGPTPCADATWIVRQTDGNICQLMSFTGSITYSPDNQMPVEVDIPKTASVTTSGCTENGALFMLTFDSEGNIWQMELSFSKEGSTYYLGRVAYTLMTSGGKTITSSEEREFFSVPVGEHYMCDTLNFNLDETEIKLASPVFQPFVQLTTDGCGLGGAHECSSESGSNTGLIVGCVLGSILVIAAGGMTFYVIRKKRKSSYSNIR